jgi:RecA/RadA recombinase
MIKRISEVFEDGVIVEEEDEEDGGTHLDVNDEDSALVYETNEPSLPGDDSLLASNDDSLILEEPKFESEVVDDFFSAASKVHEELSSLSPPSEEIIGSPKKRGRKPNKTTLLPESQEGNPSESSTDEDESADIYNQFSEYMRVQAKIESSSGIKNVIPTGIRLLDAILGGGFAIGTMPVITGAPGCGKSTLAAQVIANAQSMFGQECLSVYLDSEHAVTTQRLAQLGVRNPKIKPYTDLTLEKVFKVLQAMCLFKESKQLVDTPSIVVWDSLANTLSEKELETTDPAKVVGYRGRLMSLLIPKYVANCSKYNILFIVVNQLRDLLQLGPYATPRDLKFLSAGKEMPGGNSLKYNAFHLLELSISSALKPDMYGFDGIEVIAKCSKNKLFALNIRIPLILDYNSGFSDFWTNFSFLKLTKRMVSGAWNYLQTMPNVKFRTRDALEKYTTDQEFREEFEKNVTDAIDSEITSRYSPV